MAPRSCETPRSRRELLILTREICNCVGRRRRRGAAWSERRVGGGGTEPFELMVPIGVHTHLLASPTVARRWLGEWFGAPPAAPVGPAARTDAHDGVEHGLLMSP